MIEKIFYNIFVLGSIISIFMFPILIFLINNKYKYSFKSLNKIFVLILLLLIIPINSINFSNIKNIINKSQENYDVEIIESPEIKFEAEDIVIEVNNNVNDINVKNDLFFDISKIIPYIWISIASVLLSYNLINYFVFLYKQKKACVNVNNENIENVINKISNSMNLNKNISYLISENITTPMTIGFFNKKVILPKDIFNEENYEIILKHELYHIKNKDIEYKFLLLFLNCIYWFNPIVYMFTNQVNEILELKCDENVLENETEKYRLEYAKTLLDQIEKNRSKQYKFSMNFANRRKNIMKRFSNIVNTKKKSNVAVIATVTAILLIVSVLVIVFIPNINFASVNTNSEVHEVNTVNVPIANIEDDENKEKNEIENTTEENKLVPTVNVEDTETEKESDNKESKIVKTVNKEIEKKDKVESTNKETKLVEAENIETENKVVTKKTKLVPIENTEKENKIVENANSEAKLIATMKYTSPLKPGSYTFAMKYGGQLGGMHTGIDLKTEDGSEIVAFMDGKVIFSSYKGSYGNLVIIESKNGLQTYYAHCSELLVKEGDTVKAGDKIAKVGSTGNSTGPHLHFEIRNNNNITIDPEPYLK